jgi:hypothetical protein
MGSDQHVNALGHLPAQFLCGLASSDVSYSPGQTRASSPGWPRNEARAESLTRTCAPLTLLVSAIVDRI